MKSNILILFFLIQGELLGGLLKTYWFESVEPMTDLEISRLSIHEMNDGVVVPLASFSFVRKDRIYVSVSNSFFPNESIREFSVFSDSSFYYVFMGAGEKCHAVVVNRKHKTDEVFICDPSNINKLDKTRGYGGRLAHYYRVAITRKIIESQVLRLR